MTKAQLFSKIINKSVVGLKHSIPDGATTYDLVKGIGKKGEFSILSFKDNVGKLIQRESTYKKASDISKINEYFHEWDGKKLIYQNEYLNNEIIKLSEIIFQPKQINEKNGLYMFKKNFYSNFDRHTISYLHPSGRPKSVSYSTCWDGNKPFDIECHGVGKKSFPTKNLEYLPLFGDSTSCYSINSRINHIQKIQEKNLGISGLINDVKIVSKDELIADSGALASDPIANCDFNGIIKLSENHVQDADLLHTLAHENRHIKDFSLINQLENVSLSKPFPYCITNGRFCLDKGTIEFAKKSKQLNNISSKNKLYKRISKYCEGWDIDGTKYTWEQRGEELRAERYANNEDRKLNNLTSLIIKALEA